MTHSWPDYAFYGGLLYWAIWIASLTVYWFMPSKPNTDCSWKAIRFHAQAALFTLSVLFLSRCLYSSKTKHMRFSDIWLQQIRGIHDLQSLNPAQGGKSVVTHAYGVAETCLKGWRRKFKLTLESLFFHMQGSQRSKRLEKDIYLQCDGGKENRFGRTGISTLSHE